MTAPGWVIRLGDAVEVRLREANPTTGGLVFELLSGGTETTAKRKRGAKKPPARRRKKRN